jgi:hypothetical protein
VNKLKKIDSSKISIVIQGPVFSREGHVNFTIESAKKFFPKSEIIFSTWAGEDLDFISKDIKIILNEPPPVFFKDPLSGVEDNLHRQVISTHAGLKLATNPYVLKLRSDLILSNNHMSIINDEVATSENPFRFFKEKITIMEFGTFDCSKEPFLYHISDLAMFGLKSDLLSYWVPDKKIYDLSSSFFLHAKAKIFFGNTGFRFSKLACEQRLVISFLNRKCINPAISYIDSISKAEAYFSDMFIGHNFYILNTKKSGILLPSNLSLAIINTWLSQKKSDEILKNYSNYQAYNVRYMHIFIRKYLITFFTIRFYKGFLAIFLLCIKKIYFLKYRELFS